MTGPVCNAKKTRISVQLQYGGTQNMSTRNDSNNDLNEKSLLFRIFMGAIFSMAAVLMLWAGIDDYTTKLNRVDWPITEATVLNVEEKMRGIIHPGAVHIQATTFTINMLLMGKCMMVILSKPQKWR